MYINGIQLHSKFQRVIINPGSLKMKWRITHSTLASLRQATVVVTILSATVNICGVEK